MHQAPFCNLRTLWYTQKDGRFIVWGLYVPETGSPGRLPQYIYKGLCRFTEQPERPLEKSNPFNSTRLRPDEFDEFVLAAMAELSDDGKVPEGVTYERVLDLAEQIRKELKEEE